MPKKKKARRPKSFKGNRIIYESNNVTGENPELGLLFSLEQRSLDHHPPCKSCPRSECFQFTQAARTVPPHIQFPFCRFAHGVQSIEDKTVNFQMICKKENRLIQYFVSRGHVDISPSEFKGVCPNGCKKKGSLVQANTNVMPLISEQFVAKIKIQRGVSLDTKVYLCFQCRQIFRVSTNSPSFFQYGLFRKYFYDYSYNDPESFHYGPYGLDFREIERINEELSREKDGKIDERLAYDLRNEGIDIIERKYIVNKKYIKSIRIIEEIYSSLTKKKETNFFKPVIMTLIDYKLIEFVSDLLEAYICDWSKNMLKDKVKNLPEFMQLEIIDDIDAFIEWISFMLTLKLLRLSCESLQKEIESLPKAEKQYQYEEYQRCLESLRPREAGECLLSKLKNFPELGNCGVKISKAHE